MVKKSAKRIGIDRTYQLDGCNRSPPSMRRDGRHHPDDTAEMLRAELAEREREAGHRAGLSDEGLRRCKASYTGLRQFRFDMYIYIYIRIQLYIYIDTM